MDLLGFRIHLGLEVLFWIEFGLFLFVLKGSNAHFDCIHRLQQVLLKILLFDYRHVWMLNRLVLVKFLMLILISLLPGSLLNLLGQNRILVHESRQLIRQLLLALLVLSENLKPFQFLLVDNSALLRFLCLLLNLSQFAQKVVRSSILQSKLLVDAHLVSFRHI